MGRRDNIEGRSVKTISNRSSTVIGYISQLVRLDTIGKSVVCQYDDGIIPITVGQAK